jgi:hypothetical protein
VLQELGLVLMPGVLPVVLLRLRLRIVRSVDVVDLADAKSAVVQIVSNILFLGYEVRCALQGRCKRRRCM